MSLKIGTLKLGALCISTLVTAGALAAEPRVCGTNEKNEIWCARYGAFGQGRWEQIPGELKQVVVRDNQLWGVNVAGEIWYAPDIHVKEHWVHIAGSAKEISEGQGVICIVNDKDEVWCADKGITTEHPNWHQSGNNARLKYVSVD